MKTKKPMSTIIIFFIHIHDNTKAISGGLEEPRRSKFILCVEATFGRGTEKPRRAGFSVLGKTRREAGFPPGCFKVLLP